MPQFEGGYPPSALIVCGFLGTCKSSHATLQLVGFGVTSAIYSPFVRCLLNP